MPWPKGKPMPEDILRRQKESRRARRDALGILPATARASLSLTTTEVALITRLMDALKAHDAKVVAECVSSATFGNVRRVFSRINGRNMGELGFAKLRENGPKMPTEKRNEVFAMRQAGATYAEIAEKACIVRATAWRIVRELGAKGATE